MSCSPTSDTPRDILNLNTQAILPVNDDRNGPWRKIKAEERCWLVDKTIFWVSIPEQRVARRARRPGQNPAVYFTGKRTWELKADV